MHFSIRGAYLVVAQHLRAQKKVLKCRRVRKHLKLLGKVASLFFLNITIQQRLDMERVRPLASLRK